MRFTLSISSAIEKLRAVENERDIGLGADDLLDPGRLFAFPARAHEQVFARFVPRRPAADIGEIESVEVDELEGIIALLLDRRHGEDERLGAQVSSDIGIGRVGIRRLDRLVVRRIDTRIVDQRVPRRLVFGAALVDEIRIENPIIVDHREAVDGCLLRDGARRLRRERLRLRRRGRNSTRRTQRRRRNVSLSVSSGDLRLAPIHD